MPEYEVTIDTESLPEGIESVSVKNGEASVATGAKVERGTELTATLTGDNSENASVLVYKTGDAQKTPCVEVSADGKFTMPDYAITVSAEIMKWTATLEHTNDALWGSNKGNYSRKGLDQATAYYAGISKANAAAFMQFKDIGDGVAAATLEVEICQTDKNTNNKTNTLQYCTELTDITTINENTDYTRNYPATINLGSQTTKKSAANTNPEYFDLKYDVTAAISAAQKAEPAKSTLVFMLTGNEVGAELSAFAAAEPRKKPVLTLEKGRKVSFNLEYDGEPVAETINVLIKKEGKNYKTITVTDGVGYDYLVPGSYTYEIVPQDKYEAVYAEEFTVGSMEKSIDVTMESNGEHAVKIENVPRYTTITAAGKEKPIAWTNSDGKIDRIGDGTMEYAAAMSIEPTDVLTHVTDGGSVSYTIKKSGYADKQLTASNVSADTTIDAAMTLATDKAAAKVVYFEDTDYIKTGKIASSGNVLGSLSAIQPSGDSNFQHMRWQNSGAEAVIEDSSLSDITKYKLELNSFGFGAVAKNKATIYTFTDATGNVLAKITFDSNNDNDWQWEKMTLAVGTKTKDVSFADPKNGPSGTITLEVDTTTKSVTLTCGSAENTVTDTLTAETIGMIKSIKNDNGSIQLACDSITITNTATE